MGVSMGGSDILVLLLSGIIAGLLLAALGRLLWVKFHSDKLNGVSDKELEMADLRASASRVAQLEIQVATLEERANRLSILEAEILAERKLVSELRDVKAQAEARLAKFEESARQMELSRDEYRDRLSTAEKVIADLRAQTDEIAGKKAELEAQLSESRARLEELQKSIAESKALLEAAQTTNDSLSGNRALLREQVASLQQEIELERKSAAEKLELLVKAKEQLSDQFKALAGEILQNQSATFTQANKDQMDALLAPLQQRIQDFQLGLTSAHKDAEKERTILQEQIRSLTDVSAKMSSETHNLTRALKGEAKTQGIWGEMILETILEKSGLRKDEEYIREKSHLTEEGERRRPDAIVRLPGQRSLVIDSKVSLKAFEAYTNEESEELRVVHLSNHIESIRTHIKSLSTKSYQDVVEGAPDYVVMFVPLESALAIALQQQPDLTTLAFDNNVTIATPTTLTMALRTVAMVWQVERRNHNAEEIALRAGKLYEKFVGFVGDLSEVDERISALRGSFDAAKNKLSIGQGNLVRQVEMLKDLGAKTNKALPQNWLDSNLEGPPAIAGSD